MKYFLHITFTLFCLSVLLSSCGKDGSTISPGEAAKDFRLDTLSHERFYLNEHKGKVVVLVFWTTWCSVCKGELVELNTIKDVSMNGDLVVAGICSDPENIDTLKEVTETLKIEYPVLLDKGQTVTGKYKVSAFPTTIIIDQKGIVSFIREGYNPAIASQLKTKISSLLVSDESAE